MTRIAILFHEFRSDPAATAVHYLANAWREAGLEVVYLFGTKRFVPADLCLLHVNLSVVPDRYLRFADRYPKVLNRNITDIRKSRFSSLALKADDSWSGPVIVKSDLNYGGLPEKRIGRNWVEQRSALARRIVAGIERRIRRDDPLGSSSLYRILPDKSEVPVSWFSRKDLIIEKFLPEMEDELYHVRMYQALGDRWLCTRVGSTNPIAKFSNCVRSAAIDPHPQVIRWREELQMDYGKLDYVLVDGEPILLDVNKTTGSTPSRSGTLEDNHRYLAEGIYAYF